MSTVQRKRSEGLSGQLLLAGALGFVIPYLISMLIRAFASEAVWASAVVLTMSLFSVLGLLLLVAGALLRLNFKRRSDDSSDRDREQS